MKKSMKTIALIAGLIGAAGTASAANNNYGAASCPPPGIAASGASEASGRPMRPDMRPEGRSRRPLLKQTLGLSDHQESKMIELRKNFFTRSRPVRQELRSMKRELAVESVSKRPDKRKISALTRTIGQVHVQLAELESRHLHDVASVLDDKQLDRFMRLRQDKPHGGRQWKRG